MPSVDLPALLAPLGLAGFLADHWEREPYLGTGPADRFAGVFGLDEVEEVFCAVPERDELTGVLAVRSDEGEIHSFALGDKEPGRRSTAAMAEAFATGHTLAVNGLPIVHPRISQLCADAESHLQQPFSCNLYLTPPGAQGFLPHHDLHDTFFLQIEGTKHWSLWAPELALPLPVEQKGPPPPPQGPPTTTLVLRPGQLLYVPRGWVHAGAATDELSLHLTLGALSTTWHDLLVDLLRAVAEEDADLRAALPLAPAQGVDDEEVMVRARALLGRLSTAAEKVGTAPLEALMVRRVARRRPALEPHLRTTFTRDAVDDDTVVERRDGLRPVVRIDGPTCVIAFPGSHVEGPVEAEVAFRFVAAHRRFTVAELPGLPEGARRELTQQLVLQGLLRTV